MSELRDPGDGATDGADPGPSVEGLGDPHDHTTDDSHIASAAATTGHLPGMAPEPERLDLDSIEGDLDAVEEALDRLADGTYGIDELTGRPIPDEVLEHDPTARRS